ncbi:hypothetical protein DH2020_016256 [Rehmannia glutinosa]|uniref:DUF1985 domain-containing protein n=1 Tax=Rehmannia glutinosa TaxID=99300 RepID=A0ABR0WMG2_REHGL
MAYLTTIENRFDSRVTSRCNLQVLRLVYDMLDAVHKEMLLNSAFGELYKFHDNMQISCKLLHALLFMRIKSPVDDEVWFRVGDANVRFGFSDFTLITGLNPEIKNDFVKDIPSDRRLAAEYFGGGKKAVQPSVLKAALSTRQRMRRTDINWDWPSYMSVFCGDEVLFPLSPTQEMEKEYVVMFPGVFPEDLNYPLDEERRDVHETEHGGSSRVPPPSTGPSIGMRQVLDVVATLTKKQDDAFSFLNKKVEDAFSLMSGKIEELDRKIYALDQNLKQEVNLIRGSLERQQMGDGASPIMGRWWRQRRLREEDRREDPSVEVEKNKFVDVVDAEMHSDVEVVEVEQANTGDDRGTVKYTRKKRPSKHVEKENVLQTGVKRRRVPSIHTRTPFTTESRTQTTTSKTFLDKMQIDFFLPVDPLKAKNLKNGTQKCGDR